MDRSPWRWPVVETQPLWEARPESEPGIDRESFLTDLRKASRRLEPEPDGIPWPAEDVTLDGV
jgi:hypothetical protein